MTGYTPRNFMDLRARFGLALAARLLLVAFPAFAQTAEPPAAAPSPPTPTPLPSAASAAPLRLSEPPFLRVERLPPENPMGVTAEVPSALPAKPVFTEQVVEAAMYAAIHVDRTGKHLGSRRVRDPIPSLATDSKRSFERWTFEPARKGGQPVDTWATYRLDLHVEVRSPKIEQITLTPVAPSTPIPVPLEWGADAAWYEGLAPVASGGDGTVPVEQTDTLAVPKKRPWNADSYKGPFSIRMWVKVTAAGHAERTIVLQASDPVLIAAFRKQIAGWQFRPARVNGQPADSWGELSIAGQIGYSVDVTQVVNLRKSLPGGAEQGR